MKIRCPNCGFEEKLNFCPNCGAPLSQVSDMASAAPDLEERWTAKCPVCRSDHLEPVLERKLFGGIKMTAKLKCNTCGALFIPHGSKYTLTKVRDKSAQTWIQYGNKSLTEEEWKRIADTKQRQARILHSLTDIAEDKKNPEES